ncbi:MAG: alpha/beta fold hydrolase [Deltaproteobacteria bacterium]|nr:MAG: alpha/beta fold hydrolase [Deltaproteobacteria bacterium]
MSLLDGLNSTQIELPSGASVHLLSAGEGPCVFFVHGWPAQAFLWRHAMRALAPTHRVVALDLPASGATRMPADFTWELDAYADLIDEVLDSLQISSTGLCVHDAGGPIGLHWASRWPGRIARICLLNTLVFPELSWGARAFFASVRLPGAEAFVMNRASVRAGFRIGVRSRRIEPEALAAYAQPFADPAHRARFIHAARCFDPNSLRQLPDRLDRIAGVPLQLLYGTKDWILPDVEKTMARLRDRYPHAQSTAWPDLGHFLQEDAPDRVAEAIAAFFRSAPA